MAIIHRTTLNPGKLELLAAWLPGQPWYRGAASWRPRAGSLTAEPADRMPVRWFPRPGWSRSVIGQVMTSTVQPAHRDQYG